MYRSDLDRRDKGGAIAAVVAIHAALLFAFLNLSGKMPLPGQESVLRMFDIERHICATGLEDTEHCDHHLDRALHENTNECL